MAKGYVGALLRVRLNTGEIVEQELPDEGTLRQFVGGVGLSSKLLFDEVSPEVKPLDPENKLVFMSGPMTATTAPGANSCVVSTINVHTGYGMAAAYTHANLAAYLKYCGYDGIIFEGIAEEPVYLLIQDRKAELRKAGHLWGKDTRQTDETLRRELGGADCSVTCIGPAGENCIPGALLKTDAHHAAAKGGVGTVMGSKRVKAIVVVPGKAGVPVADPLEYLRLTGEWRRLMFRQAVEFVEPGRGTQNMGVNKVVFGPANNLGINSCTAAKNFMDPDFALECWQAWHEQGSAFKTISKGCFGCSRACGYRVEITSGPFAGYIAKMTGGGENIDGSWMLGIVEPGSVVRMSEFYDLLGVDSGTAGAAMGLAFECYEKGLITKKDTDGLELTWGNVDAAMRLLEKLVRREGFGAVLADGPKLAAERIGGDAPKYAVHIKGMGICLHDWRGAWSTLLAQIVANGGPLWQGYRLDLRTEPDLGYNEPLDPFEVSGKAEAVKKTSIRKAWEDSLGICWFNSFRETPGTLPLVPRALAALTGWKDFSLEEALEVGERVSNLQRLSCLRRGFTPEMDLEVSDRLLEAPPTGKAKGKSIGPHLREMALEYYRLMGWDPETGMPSPEVLHRLGLESAADAVKSR